MKPPRFSSAYHRAVAEATEHHATSKTYSGKFLRPHAPHIKTIIDRLGVASILDYGAGKGSQYRWRSDGGDASIPAGHTLESYWGVNVHQYDPAWPPIAADPEPHAPFDLVLCTHVLGSIPLTDLDVVVDRLARLATKAVYIAEKLGRVGKQVFSDDATAFARFDRDGWVLLIREAARAWPAIEWHLALRHPRDHVVGVVVERFEWTRGQASGGTLRPSFLEPQP